VNYTEQRKNFGATSMLGEKTPEVEIFANLKRMHDAYPLDLPPEQSGAINVEDTLKYWPYITKLPILMKMIDFTDAV
jgi:hypothetical protein